MDNFRLFLGFLFLVFLLLDGFQNYLQNHLTSFLLAAILLLGFLADWWWKRPSETISPPPENPLFQLLHNVMLHHQLELRLRRNDMHWTALFLHHTPKLTKIVSRGQGRTLPEAILDAERHLPSHPHSSIA